MSWLRPPSILLTPRLQDMQSMRRLVVTQCTQEMWHRERAYRNTIPRKNSIRAHSSGLNYGLGIFCSATLRGDQSNKHTGCIFDRCPLLRQAKQIICLMARRNLALSILHHTKTRLDLASACEFFWSAADTRCQSLRPQTSSVRTLRVAGGGESGICQGEATLRRVPALPPRDSGLPVSICISHKCWH